MAPDPRDGFDAAPGPGPPFAARYRAAMPDGSFLYLPIRPIDVAGLIATQASFTVVHALARQVADLARPLGHGCRKDVAERLGDANWVAAGYLRQLWYEEALSVPMRSITTAERRLWLDPHILPRLAGRRACTPWASA